MTYYKLIIFLIIINSSSNCSRVSKRPAVIKHDVSSTSTVDIPLEPREQFQQHIYRELLQKLILVCLTDDFDIKMSKFTVFQILH